MLNKPKTAFCLCPFKRSFMLCAHTRAFRSVINWTRKSNIWLHAFTTYFAEFDPDVWLYHKCLKQHFILSVFFRFSLMLTIYEKKYFFLVVFVYLGWLLLEYKNSFFLFLLKRTLLLLNLSCYYQCTNAALQFFTAIVRFTWLS